jgi:hypothetical protein
MSKFETIKRRTFNFFRLLGLFAHLKDYAAYQWISKLE